MEVTLGDVHESIDWGIKNTSYTAALQGIKPTDDLNNGPKEHPDIQLACETYFDEVVALGRRLLRLFALSLDLSETISTNIQKDQPVSLESCITHHKIPSPWTRLKSESALTLYPLPKSH